MKSKELAISPYYKEMAEALKKIVDEMKKDGTAGNVTWKQAEDFINNQQKQVPLNAKYYATFVGLITDGVNQLKHEANKQKVNHDDGNKEK